MIRQWSIIPAICAIMVGVHLVDIVFGGALKDFGIHPREIGTIYTIATAPWLHEDFAHLGNNLCAFVILGSLCVLKGVRYFIKASALIIIMSGAMVWLFGRDATHIGASGWIFGLWSLTIALAWVDRSLRNIAISLVVLFFYRSMAFGILPLQTHISFESHLFGAVAGVMTAWMLSGQRGVRIDPLR